MSNLRVAGLIFRECGKADLPRVQEFVQQLYNDDPGEAPARPDIGRTWAHFQKNPNKGEVVVFERDEILLGYAIVVYFWSNEFGGDVLEIDEILVDSKSRGLGIGKSFFEWLTSSHPNSVALTLQTSPGNARARALYESVGFKPSRNHYLIKMCQAGSEVSLACES